MLVQEKQADIPQYLVLCSWSVVLRKFVVRVYVLGQEPALTLFTQTKQYWNFVKTGLNDFIPF